VNSVRDQVMPKCYRCGNPVKSTDVKCSRCQAQLKAFGHAGIDLHRANGEEALCLTCAYHADDSCDYPKRPQAMECTMYQNINHQAQAIRRPGARKPQPPIWGPTKDYPDAPEPFTTAWWQTHRALIGAIGLIIFLVLLLVVWR
jgi:hypothetical protein